MNSGIFYIYRILILREAEREDFRYEHQADNPKRSKVLRIEHALMPKRYSNATGISRISRSKCEANDFKGIRLFSIAVPAKF